MRGKVAKSLRRLSGGNPQYYTTLKRWYKGLNRTQKLVISNLANVNSFNLGRQI